VLYLGYSNYVHAYASARSCMYVNSKKGKKIMTNLNGIWILFIIYQLIKLLDPLNKSIVLKFEIAHAFILWYNYYYGAVNHGHDL